MSSKISPNMNETIKDVDPKDVLTVIEKIAKIIGDLLKK